MVLKNKDMVNYVSRPPKKKQNYNKELEDMLMDEEIMGPTDVMTRRQARKTNYELACNKLQEKWCFNGRRKKIENKSWF